MDQSASSSILSAKRILVVEDEALLADELIEELEAVGAVPIETMPDISRALNAICSGDHFDAAILNVWLRGDLSFPVAEELRQRGIPFMFVTGNRFDATQQYPDIICHPKPADMKAVIQSLIKIIENRHLEFGRK